MARVVGAGARHHRALAAQLVHEQADELDLLLVRHRRCLAGGAGDHQAVRAVLEQVAADRDRRLLVDRSVRAERRDHRGQQAVVGAHEAHCRRVSPPADRRWRASAARCWAGCGRRSVPGPASPAGPSGALPGVGGAAGSGSRARLGRGRLGRLGRRHPGGRGRRGGGRRDGRRGVGRHRRGRDRAAVLVVLDRGAAGLARRALAAVELLLRLVELGLRLLGHLLGLVHEAHVGSSLRWDRPSNRLRSPIQPDRRRSFKASVNRRGTCGASPSSHSVTTSSSPRGRSHRHTKVTSPSRT